ncbi:MAG: helix-turn-helix transcriptional regulator [Okeania sp. SIO2G4]|uniref:helix-turn-helix domain-containing protein n=1 Tax=unclassified Okeania TaxID=2634635 RepID=UPI0013B7F210|nr:MULTISPECIES: helix-turn-helix transcriptional regulator [unclassified Okeania]NEP04013.1 helix-turn-helix transcriptional regulator [Okeania sp. SIO4D6]NEP39120.1 helix-turn-helix transcriptional regulator [Okeania sp. SIO2H7]NEP71643.1 helix-turn-helix transcriptional regulator [Okeania sp. SIO2G5]NEP91738.1 helix-turn-helix transcriptional regulator [Okeania sp. SIO2F5]NEQ89565.1 helix-turn-helix transcriptional regulator [Okeania sp. SIO2G4]
MYFQLKVGLAEAFGRVLKQKREALKLSQEELGFEAGLHRTYISLLERGLKSPTLDVIFRLSSALNILPSQFIAEVEKLIKTTSS